MADNQVEIVPTHVVGPIFDLVALAPLRGKVSGV